MGKRDALSLDFYETPGDGEGSFAIAGYDLGRGWKDVENGAWPIERHGLDAIGDAERVTVHYVNPDTGADYYFTTHGPFTDNWDDFVDLVEWYTEHAYES